MSTVKIRSLTTTATTSASDDFLVIDGTTNSTRKLSAATPAFLTSVTVPTVATAAGVNLNLATGTAASDKVLIPGTLEATAADGLAASVGTLGGASVKKALWVGGIINVAGHTTFEGVTSTGATGTGKLVYDTSPSLNTPALGTPSALVGTNITGTAASLTAGLATALATARAINGVNFDGTAAITVTAAGSTLSDTVTIAKGGTGQTTANDALNALLPSQAGASGKILQSDGTNTSFVPSTSGGTVTGVSVTTANGVSGTVATSTTTPAISLTLGAIIPTSVNSVVVSGASTPTLLVTGTSSISGSNTGDAPGGIAYTVTKTANYAAVANDGVLTNTTGGAFTVTLPASPSNGDQIIVADAGGAWGTNNLTIGRNGNNIADLAQDLVCDITGASVQLVYNSSGTATWEVFAQIGGNGGTAVTLTGTQTLTNKTLTAPVLTSANLTTALTLNGAAGNSGQVMTSAGSGLPTWSTVGSTVVRSARTANTILAAADNSTLIDITSGTFSQTFTAAATLGSGWFCYIRNSGTGDITLDPNSTELIDGLTTYIMYPNEVRLVQCDGSAFTSIVLTAFSKTFTATDTFVTPPRYTAFDMQLWAGGGSGRKSSSGETGGGGGGSCAVYRKNNSSMSASESVTIAAGGTAVTVADTSGNVGGNSTFSGVTAFGGNAGVTTTTNSRGGSAFSNSSEGAISTVYGGQTSATAGYMGGGYGALSSASFSVFGGGGGGSISTADNLIIGSTIFGGAGGVAALAGAGGVAGTAPGGGGGATRTGTASGAGARGELRILGIA